MKRSTMSLAAHTFAHFCVDFACFYQLFAGLAASGARLETVTIGFLTYNVIAFGLQPFIGYYCDRRRTLPVAIAGCLTVFAGLLLLPLSSPALVRLPFSWLTLVKLPLSWSVLVLCALGNACFHVGGGSEGLVNANGKMARSGVFVSSGALGVVLGTLWGKGGAQSPAMLSILLPIILLAVSAIALARINPRPTLPLRNPEGLFRAASVRYPFTAVLLLCLSSIMIRSYVGSIIPITWRTSTGLILLPAVGALAGKAAGGFLADWLGARRAGVVSLLAALPLLVWGNGNPALCVLGIVLFNVSMAITLGAVFSLLPGFPGLSFGLTTLALLVGNVPTFFLAILPTAILYVMTILIGLSAGCLFLGVADRPAGQGAGTNGGNGHENTKQKKVPETL